jgi:hypothetical protein
MCASFSHKVSVLHGDGGNHAQYNYLIFVTGPLIDRKLKKDPKLDLGYWCQDHLVCKLRPRIEFIFNSAKDHACCPHASLLPYMRDYERLQSEAEKFEACCIEETLIEIRADPTLMMGFETELQAAHYLTSVIGFTTFQQRAVTHQMLRAAATGDIEKVLRPPPAVAKDSSSSSSGSSSNVAGTEPEVLMPYLPPALSTRSSTTEARREEERALELQLLNGLDAHCIICGYPEASQSGQCEMLLCECQSGGIHGVHVACLVSEPERVSARACCGTPAERARARVDAHAEIGKPYWCPWHAVRGTGEQPTCAYFSQVSGCSPELQRWEVESARLASAEDAMLPSGTEVYVRQDGGHLRRGVVREPGATKDAEPGSVRARSATCPVDAEVLYADGGAAPRMRIFGAGAAEVLVVK